MIVVLTEAALEDLQTIADHIAIDAPGRALSYFRELRQACEGLADHPRRFPLVARYSHRGIRRRPHGDYLIFYWIIAERVEVLHILHGARDYEAVLFP